jgi:dihydropteroate synthase
VVDEVLDELRESIAFAAGAGIAKDRILVDPGLGFAKEAPHSYEALARLNEFSELGRPILVGPSRKSFLARALGNHVPATERDWATAAAVTAAALAGAHIVRVHAVAPLVQVVRVTDEIRKYHRAE